MKKGMIFNIQRFSINDGPGIRTTVFFKGCPLDCLWCHNPESKSIRRELSFAATKCIGCGQCAAVCPNGCHILADGTHEIDRVRCILCGRCVEACVGALEMMGKEMSVEEVIAEVLRDRDFYVEGGGMTVSGGEPFFQSEFLLELLRAAKREGLNVCIETSGFAKWAQLEAAASYVDLFLFDVKECDAGKHRRYTGQSNELILENLHKLDGIGAQIVLRCPLIPGLNDEEAHLECIARLAEKLNGVLRVDLEPYHPLGKSKSEQLGKSYPLPDMSFAPEVMVEGWLAFLRARTGKPVAKA